MNAAPNRPKKFYWISAIALVWNAFGILAYVGQVIMSPETLAEMPDAERALYENVPAWSTAAYAIAVHAGAIGCILLLLGKALARPLLIVSLAGVVVQNYHTYFVANTIDVMGGGVVMFSAVVVLISVFLIAFANNAKQHGWIR